MKNIPFLIVTSGDICDGVISIHIESHMLSKRNKIETSQNVMPDGELRQIFIRLKPRLDTDKFNLKKQNITRIFREQANY
jgi:hypothetical protein